MNSKKISLGGKKYLVEESYQMGGGGRKKSQMKIHKLVDGNKEKFLTEAAYRKLMAKYDLLKHQESRASNAAKYKKRNMENNMMDLIPPYQVNPAQRRLLQHLLGVRNVSEIELFNTLTRAGIINTSCPPLGEPFKSEEYVDPISGRKQCRYPTPYRKIYEDKNCPDPNGDPFAREKYIDWQGRVTCRRPVVRGAFFCPQPGAPEKTRSVTLADGTGICVEADTAKNSPALFPSQVMYPDSVNHKILMYETVFDTVNMSPDLVARVNTLLRTSTCTKDLRDRVDRDAKLGWLKGVVGKMKSPKDIKICNAALYKFAKSKMPDFFKNNRYASSTDAFLKFFDINTPSKLVMSGGAKRKPKRKTKRKAKAKRKAKSKAKAKRKPKSKAKPKRKAKSKAKSKAKAKRKTKKSRSGSSSSARSSF